MYSCLNMLLRAISNETEHQIIVGNFTLTHLNVSTYIILAHDTLFRNIIAKVRMVYIVFFPL